MQNNLFAANLAIAGSLIGLVTAASGLFGLPVQMFFEGLDGVLRFILVTAAIVASLVLAYMARTSSHFAVVLGVSLLALVAGGILFARTVDSTRPPDLTAPPPVQE